MNNMMPPEQYKCPLVVTARDYHDFELLVDWLRPFNPDLVVKELDAEEVDLACKNAGIDNTNGGLYHAVIYCKGQFPNKTCRAEYIVECVGRG